MFIILNETDMEEIENEENNSIFNVGNYIDRM